MNTIRLDSIDVLIYLGLVNDTVNTAVVPSNTDVEFEISIVGIGSSFNIVQVPISICIE